MKESGGIGRKPKSATKYKIFNGKRYKYVTWRIIKSNAQKEAEYLRGEGFLSRVVESVVNNKVVYLIYAK